MAFCAGGSISSPHVVVIDLFRLSGSDEDMVSLYDFRALLFLLEQEHGSEVPTETALIVSDCVRWTARQRPCPALLATCKCKLW